MNSHQRRNERKRKRKEFESKGVPYMDDGKTVVEVEIVGEEHLKPKLKRPYVFQDPLKDFDEYFNSKPVIVESTEYTVVSTE